MEQTEAWEILRKLRGELAEANGIVAAAQRRVAALDKLVEGYLELFPGLASTPPPEADQAGSNGDGEKRRGQDAVISIMEIIENKGRYWTVKAMVDALAERDWLPDSKGNPANAVRTALDRLAEKDPRVHKGLGSNTVVWYFQGDGYSPPRFVGHGMNTVQEAIAPVIQEAQEAIAPVIREAVAPVMRQLADSPANREVTKGVRVDP
jgi:hypothetical protein